MLLTRLSKSPQCRVSNDRKLDETAGTGKYVTVTWGSVQSIICIESLWQTMKTLKSGEASQPRFETCISQTWLRNVKATEIHCVKMRGATPHSSIRCFHVVLNSERSYILILPRNAVRRKIKFNLCKETHLPRNSKQYVCCVSRQFRANGIFVSVSAFQQFISSGGRANNLMNTFLVYRSKYKTLI
jgi:hypothetical protein